MAGHLFNPCREVLYKQLSEVVQGLKLLGLKMKKKTRNQNEKKVEIYELSTFTHHRNKKGESAKHDE